MNQQLRSFARECVSNYAKYDKLNSFYSLSVYDLPDFIQNEFTSIIMSDDNALASEATGPDNQHWKSKMLPALTRYLKNSTDKDAAIEFNKIWLDCITDYMNHKMQELVDNSIPDVF